MLNRFFGMTAKVGLHVVLSLGNAAENSNSLNFIGFGLLVTAMGPPLLIWINLNRNMDK